MTNTEIKDDILKYLITQCTVKDWYSVDGYFIFGGEKDSVTHFTVKGLLGWKFGLWINMTDDKDHPVKLFAQHKDNIDKFKPSCSQLRIKLSDWDLENGYYTEIKDMLHDMKHNHFQTYCADMEMRMPWRKSELESFFMYVENKFRIFKESVKEKLGVLSDIIYFRVYMRWLWLKKKVIRASLEDQNKNGWRSYPRYHANITVYNDVTDSEVDMIEDRLYKRSNLGFVNFYVPGTKEE